MMEQSMSDQPFPEGDPVSHDLAMLGGGGDDAMASVFQELDDLPASPHHAAPTGLEAVHEVPVKVQAVLGRGAERVAGSIVRMLLVGPADGAFHAVLGRAQMPVGDLLGLSTGMVFELDRRVGEPVDVFVNDRLVARGEVVLVDHALGVTLTEIVRAGR
jgi:flagellar motor switch protein FliN/FliY